MANENDNRDSGAGRSTSGLNDLLTPHDAEPLLPAPMAGASMEGQGPAVPDSGGTALTPQDVLVGLNSNQPESLDGLFLMLDTSGTDGTVVTLSATDGGPHTVAQFVVPGVHGDLASLLGALGGSGNGGTPSDGA